jgi:xanthine dehydrogenase YagR molybdenum-binding subunit
MTQVAAETLGLPIERVSFVLGDTRLPRVPAHGGSMTMASIGGAVQAALPRKLTEEGSGPFDSAREIRSSHRASPGAACLTPGDHKKCPEYATKAHRSR